TVSSESDQTRRKKAGAVSGLGPVGLVQAGVEKHPGPVQQTGPPFLPASQLLRPSGGAHVDPVQLLAGR
uniref:Uncharacterized protein n=1 Tax=Oryzias sinensis TaxID=183150 RepID=A0A8C7XDF9_9TELE